MALSSSCCYIHSLHPLPRPKCETEGVFPPSTHHHPHLCPLSHSKHEMEGAFPLSTHHQYPSLTPNARRRSFSPTNPFSPLKRETRVFPLSTHHLYPLPQSKCETEGFPSHQPPSPPPSLETRDGGVFHLSTHPHHPSLTQVARRRGFPRSTLVLVPGEVTFTCVSPCFNARRGRLPPSHLVRQGFLALWHLVLFK
jgi:hypothetical protein